MAAPAWRPAYVALGSNLDEPLVQVERACVALAAIERTQLVVHSPWYRTAPLGPVAQPDFVNGVAGLLTQLTPLELLEQLQRIESELGRAAPVVRWGPRRIDLDLLAHGESIIASPELTLPHPELAQRAFVLVPWAEIAATFVVPGVGRVATLLERLRAMGGADQLTVIAQ